MRIEIPVRKPLMIEHLVLDFNGTLATDGKLIDGVEQLLNKLSEQLCIHVITADTFGTVAKALKGVNCRVIVLEKAEQDKQKKNYVKQLGSKKCVAIGNGFNDSLMLKFAALGIVTIQSEGAATKALQNADIACTSIIDALNLLLNPKRIAATLRR